ncbi:cell envelope integrity protein CreD [Marinoscillum sp. MHG1-6]|uniref:cell envelope integrity protein CreD n=1 Tax=Marinoscillum sp. MHG1-6 TaxID=2959627 RepID=UPI0021575196|nr:cell envelope integrity protein CreD [Marinoscillum sp. MHG1-6]
MKNEHSIPDRAQSILKNTISIKLILILSLILLLLIPTSYVKSLIEERETINQEANQEVRSKWANEQTINGPIISIPLLYEFDKEVEKEVKFKDGKEIRTEIVKEIIKHEETRLLHILPEELYVDGTLKTEQLHRGIYDIIVYRSDSKIEGHFIINPDIDPKGLKSIHWNKAFLTLGISDLRGINEALKIEFNKQHLYPKPGSRIPQMVPSGITVELPDLSENLEKPIEFSLNLNLQGSGNISFVPVGGITKVKVQSEWSSPSFEGKFLPDSRSVSDSGFNSDWEILHLNRNFPQSWIDNKYASSLKNAAFGVNLILALDDYQKAMRSAKYAIMTIALTFLVFFLVEILNNRKIHPFQYTLVGLALCLFYVLLISISEHIDFNLAYAMSSMITIASICSYSLSVFKNKKLALVLLATLIGIYGFLFVTIQLADYALLMGSIGLSLILSTTMYFTRNINWYQLQTNFN